MGHYIWDEMNNIDDDEELMLVEMATVGHFLQKRGDAQNKTGYKAMVTSDNYPRAHLHCYNQADNKRICIDLTKASYFSHDKWQDHFNKDEAKMLDNFLRSQYKYPQVFRIGNMYYNVQTNWHYAIYQWKLENDDIKDNISLAVNQNGYVIFPEQPDYSLL